ncbi:MAG: DUF6020 family protein, partial [Clostridia bacterium]|nr:DUF6020 family protein [Clostridia bacterium]
VLASLGVACILGWTISFPLYDDLGYRYKSPQEGLAVPAQQISYVARDHWDDLTDWQRGEIERIFGENQEGTLNPGDIYNPRNADETKRLLTNQKLDEIVKLWLNIGKDWPLEYTEALFTLNLQLWYPDAAYPDKYSERIYIEDDVTGWEGQGQIVSRQSKSQPLFDFYHAFAQNGAKWQRLPGISLLCSVGTYIWIMFVALLLCWTRKKARLAAAMLPAAALWLTYLAGPLTAVRYVFPLIACLPVFVAVAAEALRGGKKEKQEPLPSGESAAEPTED